MENIHVKTSQLTLSLMLIISISKCVLKSWALFCKYFSGRQNSKVKHLVVAESRIRVSVYSQSQKLEGEATIGTSIPEVNSAYEHYQLTD